MLQYSTPLEEPKDADVCNVFKLYKLLGTDESNNSIVRSQYEAGNFGYGHAKQALFELIIRRKLTTAGVRTFQLSLWKTNRK